MKFCIILLCVFTAWQSASAQIVVFPFSLSNKVDAQPEWLGTSLAYYLAWDVRHNGGTVIYPDQVVQMLLDNNVSYPFVMSAATAVKLARQKNSEILIRGRIDAQPAVPGAIVVHVWLYRPRTAAQRKQYVFNGVVADLHALRQDILTWLGREIAPDQTWSAEAMPLPPADEERFSKLLLPFEPIRKLEYLKNLAEKYPGHPLLQFEAARACLDQGAWNNAQTFLQRVSPLSVCSHSAQFLLGIVHLQAGEVDAALRVWQTASELPFFAAERQNNLAVACMLKKMPLEAEQHVLAALALRKDALFYLNKIALHMQAEREELAWSTLVEALRQFPEHDQLLTLFSYWTAACEWHDYLYDFFKKYIDDFPLKVDKLSWELVASNPFGHKSSADTWSSGEIPCLEMPATPPNRMDDATLARLGEGLRMNPFCPASHFAMALALNGKGQWDKALGHALAALFLQDDGAHYNLVLQICHSLAKRELGIAVWNQAQKKYAANSAIQSLKWN